MSVPRSTALSTFGWNAPAAFHVHVVAPPCAIAMEPNPNVYNPVPGFVAKLYDGAASVPSGARIGPAGLRVPSVANRHVHSVCGGAAMRAVRARLTGARSRM